MNRTSTLRQELSEQYPELSGQSVATALDQATRAAALLTNSTDGRATVDEVLVAMLARDRLDARSARFAAASRRVLRVGQA